MVKKLNYIISLMLCLCVQQSLAQEKDIVLDKLKQALGGSESIQQARFFVFSCKPLKQTETVGLHRYLYDWENGNTRFEGETKDKQSIIVLFNAKTKTGNAYLNNEKIDSLDLVSSAIQYFKEDSFWLFTPILLGNKKMAASIEHTQLFDSKRYYVIKVESPTLFFQYSKLFLDTSSGIIYHWQTFNQDEERNYDFICSSHKDIGGGLKLPTKFTDSQRGASIQYSAIAALINIETDKLKKP